MNQNLLIVDDEKEILSWLEELFRYEFDMEIGVYTARTALDAIKMLAKIRFDVVLTDICMPGMDGITLFEHIKENWPRCKTVFLTGYRNFEDVYRVINHQDVRYILKSEDDDVILDAVRESLLRSKRELEQEQQQREQQSWMDGARYWLRRELMNQLCTGVLSGNLSEKMKMAEIPIDPQNPVLLFLIRVEKDWKDNLAQEHFLHEEALAQIFQENVPIKLRFYIHNMDNGQNLLLVQPQNSNNTDWELNAVIAQGAVEYAQERFRNLYHSTFSVVAAPEASMFHQIPTCIRAMKKYMVGYVGGAREVILKMEAMEPVVMERSVPDAAALTANLRNLLEMRKKQEYFALLGKMLRQMTERTGRHDTVTLEIYYSISIFLLQFINENHLNEQLAFRLGIYKLTMAEAHGDWIEAAAYLTEVSEAVFSLLETNEIKLADHALKRVAAYIDSHLNEELSLTALADIGGFNASYLSRIFKQLQKETISDYILHKRMELAKNLLTGTNEKIQEIAVRTGYLSPHSFTRAFRNEIGISPTEYRELKRGGARSNDRLPM